MAISVFGVTYTAVHAHYFPSIGVFGAGTVPTSATVAKMIDAEAASLAGALAGAGLSPAALEATTTTAAYAWCADAIRLGAAIRCAEAMQGWSAVPAAWRDSLKAKYDLLDKSGAVVLGDAASDSSVANSVFRSHTTEHDLENDQTNISNVTARFTRDDAL